MPAQNLVGTEIDRVRPLSMFVLPDEGPLPPITLQNDRVVLRPFEARDLALIEAASSDPFIPVITTVPETFTEEAGLAFIARQPERLRTRLGWSLAVVDAVTDQAVAQIGLWIPMLHHGRAEIGYWTAPPFRRQGHLTAALLLLSDWAFASLDIQRLTLYIEPWNQGSIKTAESGGYEQEVLLRSWQRVGGDPKDMWAYTRLRQNVEG